MFEVLVTILASTALAILPFATLGIVAHRFGVDSRETIADSRIADPGRRSALTDSLIGRHHH